MLNIKTILLVIIGVVAISCNTKVKDEKNVAVATETREHSEGKTIQLNDGKKWKVDDEMMVHIRNMEKEVVSLDKEKPENYKVAAGNLKKNLDLLTSNCTMNGQAHDELHIWLLPFIELVEDFSKDKSNENLAKIQESFTTFNQYFE